MDRTPRLILLIEDNPGDVRLIQAILSESKYGFFNVLNAPRLSAGLEMLKREPVDLILLDLGLPDSQGIDTFNRVKTQAAHLPIVILTGQNDEMLGTRAVGEGAQDYLLKGDVDSNLLARALSYAIERKRTEVLLLDYQERLRSLASELSLAEERERRRIATDVHDNISQTLAFCTMKLSLLLKSAGGAESARPLQEIYDCMQEIATETRSLTFELSPPELYDFGLEAALRGLAERMSKEHGIPIFFTDDEKKKDIERDMRVELFRMVRELIINALKHAKADSVKINISRNGKAVQILVQDDGVGFDTKILENSHSGGYGLFSIKERLEYMGGHFEVESRKGQGSCFTIIAPLKMEKNAAKKSKN